MFKEETPHWRPSRIRRLRKWMKTFFRRRFEEYWECDSREKGVDAVYDYAHLFGISFYALEKDAILNLVLNKIAKDYKKAEGKGEKFFEKYKVNFDHRLGWFNTYKNWIQQEEKDTRTELVVNNKIPAYLKKIEYLEKLLARNIKLKCGLQKELRKERQVTKKLIEQLDEEKQISKSFIEQDKDLKVQLNEKQQKIIGLNSGRSEKHNLSNVL